MDAAPPAATRPATFGTASLVFAILTVVSPVAVFFLFGQQVARDEQARGSHGWGPLLAILVGVFLSATLAGLSSLAGTLTGVASLAHGERRAWRPVVGLLVNVPVLLTVAYAVIVHRMING